VVFSGNCAPRARYTRNKIKKRVLLLLQYNVDRKKCSVLFLADWVCSMPNIVATIV
jgi:hypothetical protein